MNSSIGSIVMGPDALPRRWMADLVCFRSAADVTTVTECLWSVWVRVCMCVCTCRRRGVCKGKLMRFGTTGAAMQLGNSWGCHPGAGVCLVLHAVGLRRHCLGAWWLACAIAYSATMVLTAHLIAPTFLPALQQRPPSQRCGSCLPWR